MSTLYSFSFSFCKSQSAYCTLGALDLRSSFCSHPFFQLLKIIEVDYFEALWPRPVHNESKHACNGERECFEFARF